MPKHPIIEEYRKVLHDKIPNALELLVHFNLDEGPYEKELSEINRKFTDIENQLNEIDCENQSLLREQLMGLIPDMEKFYQKSVNSLSENELKCFNEYLKECEDYMKKVNS
jgi:hypothetical protein